MTVVRGFTITIMSGLVFSLCGAVLGYSIGRIVPDYYRTVFRIPADIEIDPIEVGLGLGITQGLAAGLVTGLVVVLAVSWYQSRIAIQSQ